MFKLRSAVVVLAVVVGACSGGGGGGGSVDVAKDPTAALKAAGKRTGEGGTVKMSVSVGSGAARLMTGNGAFDFAKKLGRFKLNTTVGLNFDLVFSADELYMRTPAPSATDKQWIAVRDDANATGNPVTGFLARLRGQLDPREALINLDSLVKDVKLIGSAEIRGEKTTHLRGRIDLSDEAIAKTPESMHEQLHESQANFGKEGYDVDAWLDNEGRVRRFQFATGAAGLTGASTVTMDLYGYGEDPKIVVPKASEVEEGTYNPSTTVAP